MRLREDRGAAERRCPFQSDSGGHTESVGHVLPLPEDEEILVGTPAPDPVWPDPMGTFVQVSGRPA